jgi:dolichyl-phosphate-mannose--protein O-mannosyl transferase
MSFGNVLSHAFEAYNRNIRLISFFSVPFLIAFPLSLLLPNFISVSGTFLRFGSIQRDISALEAAGIIAVFLVALALISFAIVSINLVIKSQRTLIRLKDEDLMRIESSTVKMFFIFLLVFAVTLAINMFLYEYGLHTTLGAAITFVAALAVLFAPQAIVIDELSVPRAISMSMRICAIRLPYLIGFMAIAAVLILACTQFFIFLQPAFGGLGYAARFMSIAVNGLVILPFLEVLKTQIYLSKYTIL